MRNWRRIRIGWRGGLWSRALWADLAGRILPTPPATFLHTHELAATYSRLQFVAQLGSDLAGTRSTFPYHGLDAGKLTVRRRQKGSA